MLYLHRSERADALVESLGDVLRAPLADPFTPEVVAVPTRGVERWLAQRLSHRLGVSASDPNGTGERSDGVCGNLAFPFPGRLIGDAITAASGVAHDDDQWTPERAVWPLLEAIDAGVTEPWLSTLAGHLGGDADQQRSRRFTTARHLADLFDRYAVHRPTMVRSWAAGGDVSASGSPLPAGSAWQAELWRRLRERIGTTSPAERLDQACEALTADPSLVDLPERISVFGLTRLPASYLDVLRALATRRDVHLFLLHPSPALWERVADATPAGVTVARRADDTSAGLAQNPLLRSWGRDAREMQLVLTAGGTRDAVVDEHTPPAIGAPVTLLERLQDAVRRDTPPPEADARPLLDPDDRSVQVHACHGRARQVEVLRDAVLHLLADDPTLEPRDVIVMCPDIEEFAPLIQATFGAVVDEDDDGEAGERGVGASDAPVDLRVRLADRSLRQTNPVLSALSALLDLADARVTATQVLDFAARQPVRRRFRLDDDDLERVGEWVSSTAIRWGLDGEHRRPFKLANVEQNTWRTGLDRVLLGVTMAEEDQRLVEGVLPLDDVDSGAIDLAGRFAELVDRLHAATEMLSGRKTIAEWAAAIGAAGDAMFAVSDRDSWQRHQLRQIVDEVAGEAGHGSRPSAVLLDLTDLRALLADRLRGQPTRANFRTGHLTFCTLVPMRSVPHRVVCLLGLDDNAFPRRTERDGDDLVAVDPFVGDGDGRSEDRQLLLDSMLAATERLVITYSGNDERTNAPLAPAVPVGELLDAIDATVRLETVRLDTGRLGDTGATATAPSRRRVVTRHPLQPFDVRNFRAGDLGSPGAWSFDPGTLQAAVARTNDRRSPPAFLPGRLPPMQSKGVIELDQLVRFVKHPVRAFLRQRLGISLGDFTDVVVDAMPVELDGLQKWAVGERVLAARLAGVSPDACAASERARGDLPPDLLAPLAYADVAANVELLVAEAAKVVDADASVELDSVELTVPLDDGRLLVGTVAGVVGSTVRTVTYSRLAAKHRAAAWVWALALAAADKPYEVVTIGRSDKRGRKTTVSRFPEFADAGAARSILLELVDLYDRGMCEPLPIACATSAAYVEALRDRKDPAALAAKEWAGDRFGGENGEAEHVLVYEGRVPFDDVLAVPPCDDEIWDTTQPSRFGRYALRFWSALLDHEQLDHIR